MCWIEEDLPEVVRYEDFLLDTASELAFFSVFCMTPHSAKACEELSSIEGGEVVKRSTAATVARIAEVAELIINGAATSEIRLYAQKNEWGVKDRSVDDYIRKAKDLIAQTTRDSRALRINLADRRLNMVFARSMRNKDYSAAMAALREYNKLFGLYGEAEAGEHQRAEVDALSKSLQELAGELDGD